MATLATFLWRALAQPASRAAYQLAPADDPYRLRALPHEDVFFYCKRIDNSRLVREANPREPRQCWSAIGAACLLAALLLGALAPRMAGVAVGYQLQRLKQEQQRLLNEQHDLDVLEAGLTTRKHLQELANSRQLDNPTPGQLMHLNPRGDGKLALNTH